MTIPPSRSYKAGKRGLHKHQSLPETKRWLAEHMPPAQPPWMDDATFRLLVMLKEAQEA